MALAAALALFVVALDIPVRELAADPPSKLPGSQAVEALHWAQEQVDFLTSGLTDWQLYSAGNILFYAGLATAIGAAYTWRTTLAPPWIRARKTKALMPLNAELQKRIEAAGGRSYEQLRADLRKHIRAIPAGTPHRRELVAAADDEEEVDRILQADPKKREAILATVAGKHWMEEYEKKRNLTRDARAVELYAKGVLFEEATTRLLEFFATDKGIPPGLPFKREFLKIDTPEKFQKWLARPEVEAFLESDRTDVVVWTEKLKKLVADEDNAFREMQTRYRGIAKEVLDHLEQVDKAGRGYIYIARLVQPNLKFEMDRYPFERYGTYYTLNDGGYEGRAFGRRVHETLAVLDKTNRNLEHGIRVEHGQACRNRLAALAVPVLAILAGGVGWALRDAGNRRVKDRTGVSADDTLAKGQAHAKEVGEAKAKDATEPPAVSKRLAEARAKGDETELRDLYATLRKTLRKKEHLPVVAATIRQSPFVSKQSLEVAKFEEKLKTFLEDNDAADAILDQALAEATKGAAADVQGIKDLLFGDDKTKAAFREKTYALLYPSVVKTLWPGVVPDTAPFSIDDPLAAMRKDAQADIEAISGRYRARPAPVVKPTEIGRNP